MAGLVDEVPAEVLIQITPDSFSDMIGRSFPDVIGTDTAGAFPGIPDECTRSGERTITPSTITPKRVKRTIHSRARDERRWPIKNQLLLLRGGSRSIISIPVSFTESSYAKFFKRRLSLR